MGRNYERLGVETFGRFLLQSGDLDPVYLALPFATQDLEQLSRWLVAYWCYYDCGVASWASEHKGRDFWRVLHMAALNEEPTPTGSRWPRGHERRHFRGAAAVRAVTALEARYGDQPEGMVEFLAAGPMDIRSVISRAKSHLLFGDWIGFKVADMLDAVVGETVAQDDLNTFLYDTPRKSILAHWRRTFNLTGIAKPKDEGLVLREAMAWLAHQLTDCTIPHKSGEPLDLFSLETVWCKHHSHMNGHYPLNNDIDEISRGLHPWTTYSKTAGLFLKSMPS